VFSGFDLRCCFFIWILCVPTSIIKGTMEKLVPDFGRRRSSIVSIFRQILDFGFEIGRRTRF
jgi:hypothetical protein